MLVGLDLRLLKTKNEVSYRVSMQWNLLKQRNARSSRKNGEGQLIKLKISYEKSFFTVKIFVQIGTPRLRSVGDFYGCSSRLIFNKWN